MKIRFHGAASEVGRSCISLTTDKGNRYLLDFGIKFKENGFQIPEGIEDVENIKAVFLSHAHLDHAGGLPLIEKMNLNCPIFCTKQTFAIVKILLKDSYKIERIRNLHPAYGQTDLKEVQKDTRFVNFDKWYDFGDLKFMYLNAGHIPGSAMILIEVEGKRVLYTGDYNARSTMLMNSEFKSPELSKPVDILITESTYGHRDLPNAEELEAQMAKSIMETLEKKGSVVIPVFALGRAQETLLMVAKNNFKAEIYIDGLCKKITRSVIDTNSKYVSNIDKLSHVFNERAHWIGSLKKRNDAIRKGGIFITTSGMLQGGPVMEYIKAFWADEKSKIMLMGFQCKRTNGRHLIEEGFLYIDGWRTFVKCKVEKYDFSGHSDRMAIHSFVTRISPKVIVFQHGDEEAILDLKEWAHANTKALIYAPVVGDTFEY